MKEIEKAMWTCKEKAIKAYKQGNVKEGKKWEKKMKYFKSLL